MRRATITIPDDLERELEAFLSTRDAAPSLAALLQAALRKYLGQSRQPAGGVREPAPRYGTPPAAPQVGEAAGGPEPGAAARDGSGISPDSTDRELRRRAVAAAGRFGSGRGDVARRHDERLADAFRS